MMRALLCCGIELLLQYIRLVIVPVKREEPMSFVLRVLYGLSLAKLVIQTTAAYSKSRAFSNYSGSDHLLAQLSGSVLHHCLILVYVALELRKIITYIVQDEQVRG